MPDNAATSAFLLSTVVLGTRVTKGEQAVVLKRIAEFGDVRRWIALRLLVPDPGKPSEDISALFVDLCWKPGLLEEKGFFWTASELAFRGSEKCPEFRELFSEFSVRLPYAIQWAAEDDAKMARDESGGLYFVPQDRNRYFTREGWFSNPIGYVLEMAREASKGKAPLDFGPRTLYSPTIPAKSPRRPAKPKQPEQPKEPENGAQIPAPGLAVAVLLIGVAAFQIRRSTGRK